VLRIFLVFCMYTIEVSLSPALFQHKTTTHNFVVVIVDVLRATTAFCAAFDSGIEIIVPVSSLDELLEYKSKGYLTAAERDGKKVDFADFGNSPTIFLQSTLAGKALAYSTTNGTQAIEKAKSSGNVVIAAFVNLQAVCEWLSEQQKNIVILCSGWKNSFSLEDSLCAGAIVELLEQSGGFKHICDASGALLSLWEFSKNNLNEVVSQGNHYQRLLALGLREDLKHCFKLNISKSLPVWDGKGFRDISKKTA
jgi:2-phosphosulfolactate phosphatase